MSVLGKWRIVEMPDYTDDYLDMVGPAYILFEPRLAASSPSAACTGAHLMVRGDDDAVEFTWEGNDEMDEA